MTKHDTQQNYVVCSTPNISYRILVSTKYKTAIRVSVLQWWKERAREQAD